MESYYLPEHRGMAQVAANLYRVRLPRSGRVKSLQAHCQVLGFGSGTTSYDCKINGVSCFAVPGDRPAILSNEYASQVALATAAAKEFQAGDLFTIDCATITETPPQDVQLIGVLELDNVPIGDIVMTAGENLSALRVVRTDGGVARLADTTNPAHAHTVVGITTEAVSSGDLIQIRTFGEMIDLSWSWTIGNPIFFTAIGGLTQIPPATGFLQPVAIPVTGSRILIHLADPVLR